MGNWMTIYNPHWDEAYENGSNVFLEILQSSKISQIPIVKDIWNFIIIKIIYYFLATTCSSPDKTEIKLKELGYRKCPNNKK